MDCTNLPTVALPKDIGDNARRPLAKLVRDTKYCTVTDKVSQFHIVPSYSLVVRTALLEGKEHT